MKKFQRNLIVIKNEIQTKILETWTKTLKIGLV